MIQLPQIEGAILDLITIVIFFAILFTQSKDIRTSRNFFIAILSCIIIDSADLFYNAASIPLFFIIYFVFFRLPDIPILSKINYFIKSLLITLIFVNISGILALKLMNRFNIAGSVKNLV